jgi:CRISPR-associated protein Csb1
MTVNDINMETLKKSPRLLIEADLKPIQGDRFQPTGFPDLGAAVYETPDNKRMLLVESAQSVANRLEQTCLQGSGPRIMKELDCLPYLVAKIKLEINPGTKVDTETSSLIEAHRINSPYFIKVTEFKKSFTEMAQYTSKGAPNWNSIAKALLYYDPNSLLHGVFMSNLEGGRMRLQRALSGFIEAENIEIVSSGGVKNDIVDPKGEIQFDSKAVKKSKDEKDEDKDKTHYGNVPYHRTEFTADRITAYFNFDLALLNGYKLDKKAEDLLIALGLYKIRRFLDSGLRLRTACDLRVDGNIRVMAPEKYEVPEESALLEFIQDKIKECTKSGLFANPPVTVLTPSVTQTKKEKKDTDRTREDTKMDESSDEAETTT